MIIGSGEGSTMKNFTVCMNLLIVRDIKYRRLRWAGHVTRMEEGRSALPLRQAVGHTLTRVNGVLYLHCKVASLSQVVFIY